MKKLLVLALGMVFLLGAGGRLLAQPEATGYTLSDIYYYLTEGTEPTWGNHSLDPQSGVPGQDVEGFNQSMEDIVYYMSEAFGQCNITVDDFIGKGFTGKVFFATGTMAWGPVTVMATPTPTPTPTPAPSPTPLWYDTYGPDGTKDVVKIGSMYVASKEDGTGCASGGSKQWSDACSWGTDLEWCGKTDWRLPSRVELKTICENRESLGSYIQSDHWSTSSYWDKAWRCSFVDCYEYKNDQTCFLFLRVVRGGE